MDTSRIEVLLEKIVDRLDDLVEELQWYKDQSFANKVVDRLGNIDCCLDNVNDNLSRLERNTDN